MHCAEATSLRVAGVDEAGCGPLAGPVAVAAVILDSTRRIDGLADSKCLAPKRREALCEQIIAHALAWCVVFVEVEEIDACNILQARLRGMTRALLGLSLAAEHALVDGNRLPADLPCPAQAIIGGDAIEPCISAASILAKVHRDQHMTALDQTYPGYGFAVHKGYATVAHRQALQRLGPCPQHRRSFAPIQALLLPIASAN